MANVHNTFFYRHDGGVVVIVHGDVERRAAHGNDRCRRQNPIVIGLTAPLLDVNLYPSGQNVQQIAPIAGVLAEDNIRVRIDFESAAIGNLELRVAVSTGDDNLLDLNLIADIERPGRSIAEYRYISFQGNDLGSAFGGLWEHLGRANRRAQYRCGRY